MARGLCGKLVWLSIENAITIMVALVGAGAAILAAVLSSRASRDLESLRVEWAKDADERAFAYAKAKALHERQMDVARDLWVAASELRSAVGRATGAPAAPQSDEVQAAWAKVIGDLQNADAAFQAASRSAAPFLPEVRIIVDDLDAELLRAIRLEEDRRLNLGEAISASPGAERQDALQHARTSRDLAQVHLKRATDLLEQLLSTLQSVVGSLAAIAKRPANVPEKRDEG